MPDESCRKCGGNLTELKKCSECNQTSCWICTTCKHQTLEQFHSCCDSISIIPESNQKFNSFVSGMAAIT